MKNSKNSDHFLITEAWWKAEQFQSEAQREQLLALHRRSKVSYWRRGLAYFLPGNYDPRPSVMTRLQHLALKTNDLEATRTFYLELLALSGRYDAEAGHLWVNFDDGFVLRFDRSEDAPNGLAVQYLGLELASFEAVDRTHERLATHVPVRRDLRETYRHAQGPYGFFVADPNGYLIKIFRYHTPT